MRTIWKGAISFGLVTIPVKLYSATEEKDVAFHQVRRQDGSRIRYRRVAEADGEEVPYSDIAKGFELPTGETVVLTDEDFADLPLATQKTVEVLQFVPAEEVDPIYFAKSYYLEPEQIGVKPYVLLREALEASGRIAIVKVALRQRETLATLRVRDGVLVLETMLWPDEIRTPDFGFLDEDVEVKKQEMAMAESLITALSGAFDPDGLHRLLPRGRSSRSSTPRSRAARSSRPPTEDGDDGSVVDLMAALRASVEAAKKARGEAADARGGRNRSRRVTTRDPPLRWIRQPVESVGHAERPSVPPVTLSPWPRGVPGLPGTSSLRCAPSTGSRTPRSPLTGASAERAPST